ncbi:MAG TPA: DUF2252 family protein [Candidatus Cybelea sp.]|jgi:hypothetical protein|nr:DUF2252 family protein [Candidatus Cybelea sp.]
MNIRQASSQYESWLATRLRLLPGDLRLKHSRMRAEAFPFFRATYYRWAHVWPEVCCKFGLGPKVLSVGDLHVENFGTWRDTDGRLVWGVNDFDEAYPLPYTNDLVRLTTSALLACAELDVPPKRTAEEILRGYSEGLKAGGEPFVLGDRSTALRDMARHRLIAPEKFWAKLRLLVPLKQRPRAEVIAAIDSILPPGKIALRYAHRIAGLGSLGRERYTGLGVWLGGTIAREAKAVAPSACAFAEGKKSAPIHIGEIVSQAVRVQDPFWKVRGPWIVRRLSPDCFRLELAHLPRQRDELYLLHCMGWETANIHLGSGSPAAILRDLRRKPGHWLLKAASQMRDQVMEDWREFST